MLQTGSLIGNYQIEALLGQGGMGVVYEAIQLSLHRRVALKVITPELSRNERFQERFRREARSQAALDHPNVVTVHDFGDADGQLYISMQLVQGPSLKDLITRGELDLNRVARILRPIADALDTAHDAGMVHRDFKPQNILVGGRDHAYLADFGLTQALGEPGLTRTGQFVGTLDYIAPEQIHGRPATRRSDVYAFGAVLFECLTGRVPYPRESDAAVLFAHVSEPPPRPSELRADVPAEVDAVLERAMAKDPEHRLDSASAVMDALGAARRLPAEPPPRISTTPKPKARRKPILIALAVLLVAAATGAGFLLADRGPTEAEQAHTAYLEAVEPVLTALGEQQTSGRETLAGADTQPEQIEATQGLANTYEQASADVEAITPPAADAARHRRLVDLVNRAETEYTAMSTAASAGDTDGYNTNATNVGRTEAELNQVITALRAADR